MINSLIQYSAFELASFVIRINGVAPGITNNNHRVNENFTESDNKKCMKDISKLFLLINSVVKPEDILLILYYFLLVMMLILSLGK